MCDFFICKCFRRQHPSCFSVALANKCLANGSGSPIVISRICLLGSPAPGSVTIACAMCGTEYPLYGFKRTSSKCSAYYVSNLNTRWSQATMSHDRRRSLPPRRSSLAAALPTRPLDTPMLVALPFFPGASLFLLQAKRRSVRYSLVERT